MTEALPKTAAVHLSIVARRRELLDHGRLVVLARADAAHRPAVVVEVRVQDLHGVVHAPGLAPALAQGLDADFAPPLRHVLAVTGPPCPAPRWSDPHHPNPNPNPNPSPNPAPH